MSYTLTLICKTNITTKLSPKYYNNAINFMSKLYATVGITFIFQHLQFCIAERTVRLECERNQANYAISPSGSRKCVCGVICYNRRYFVGDATFASLRRHKST